MAKNYEIEEYMHNSIYSKDKTSKPYTKRTANIYFSEPEKGINEDTGILLLIAGFTANANSNVYKKMREQFADQYNLVTVQCDYFGYEFMQRTQCLNVNEFDHEALKGILSEKDVNEIYEHGKFNPNKMVEIIGEYGIHLYFKEDLSKETLENFNDMGIMQALDNIVAVVKVMSIIYENGYKFNTKKVIIYGQSQGAYLSYLCNRFCPTLFSLIIDNSAWLYPKYFLEPRVVTYFLENSKLTVTFEYLAEKLNINPEILDLNYLYLDFKNNCTIISYHGTTDNLIPNYKKRVFCSNLNRCSYNEITDKDVDGEIFKSTNHGLDADFLKLFDFIMSKLQFQKDNLFNLEEQVVIKTSNHDYTIDYTNILPLFNAEGVEFS